MTEFKDNAQTLKTAAMCGVIQAKTQCISGANFLAALPSAKRDGYTGGQLEHAVFQTFYMKAVDIF